MHAADDDTIGEAIAGLCSAWTEQLDFDPPEGATAALLARVAPFCGQPVLSIGWTGLPRLRALRLGRALVVAHAAHARAVAPLPDGPWWQVERRGQSGFTSDDGVATALPMPGFSVAWLRAA